MSPAVPRRAAVVGAGISGVVAAAHLKKNGVDVTVFERSPEIGGVWVYDPEVPLEPFFPAINPSEGELSPYGTSFAPPGPCYRDLQNNVPTSLMKTSLCNWPEDTPEIVPHYVVKEYIQNIARTSDILESIQLNSSVLNIEKADSRWLLEVSSRRRDSAVGESDQPTQSHLYDTVIVASGHYHAPRVPDIPGLSQWKELWTDRVIHSKRYRNPEPYTGKNVLLIGAGTSSTDIAKELNVFANQIFQSARDGLFDFPASSLPPKAIRISEIEKFELPEQIGRVTNMKPLGEEEVIPLGVHLKSGEVIRDLHSVIVCTGYHITLPFLQKYHQNKTLAADADELVLVTDGTQIHNLHKDIFYIPDPSLIFIGVPYFTATFNLFDFQAMAIGAVVSGKAELPDEEAMRKEYLEKLNRKGPGKVFHSLKDISIDYVDELLDWVNSYLTKVGEPPLQGNSAEWLEKYQKHAELIKLIGRGSGNTSNTSS